MRRKHEYAPVLVEWTDSAYLKRSWQSPEEVVEWAPVDCVSVAFLIRRTEDAVILASSLNHEPDGALNQVGDVHVIPSACVRSMTYLRAGRPLKDKA